MPDIVYRRCWKCKQDKPLEDFYKNRAKPDGLCTECKDCSKAAKREWQIRNREYRANYLRGWRAENPDKGRPKEPPPKRKREAHRAVQTEVRAGRLVPPGACEDCGSEKRRTEAHHEDYSKKLDVEWLCRICQGKRHHPARQIFVVK